MIRKFVKLPNVAYLFGGTDITREVSLGAHIPQGITITNTDFSESQYTIHRPIMYSAAMTVVIFQKLLTMGCLYQEKCLCKKMGVRLGGIYLKGMYFEDLW